LHNKVIVYRDRKWPAGVRFIPKDAELVKKIIFSRNKISSQMITWINEANSGKNYEEWQACQTDEEVAEIVKRDAKLKGCVLRKQFSEEELKSAENSDSSLTGFVPIREDQHTKEDGGTV